MDNGNLIMRIQKLDLPPDRSAFLWGPRKTGKTTLLLQQFPHACWIDLLNYDLFLSLSQRPTKLRQILEAQSSKTVVIDEIQRHGLFFLDSRTTKYTIARELAEQMGAKTCERKVFLDNLRSTDAIWSKLIELCQKAKEEGEAVGIGHPYPETISVLQHKLPQMEKFGCKLVSIQEICR